jgi:glycosyltransferase involved in cell wall biosynthesis
MTQQLLALPTEVRTTVASLSTATGAVSVSSSDPLTVTSARQVASHRSLQEPVRILHIISDLCVAGAEIKLCKVLAATNRERFAPAVISMRNRGDLREQIEAMGIPVHTLGIRGSIPGPIAVARLIRIVRRLRPALIHGWMYHGNLAAQFSGMLTRKRPSILWSVHQSLYNFDYEKRLTAQIIKFCARISRLPDKIIYNSNTSAAQHEAIGYRQDKRLVLGYGFDTSKFAPSMEARHSVRVELGIPQEAILIGLAGRYHPAKDHGNFLRAAALLADANPKVRFVLCGRQVDGKNSSLNELIQSLGLTNCTYLLGERRDMQRLIAALDIAVSSSSTEGFPNVVGEAMSSGVPCVVTAVSDLPQVVGETGRAVPPRNAAALAAALEELIAIGAEGRQCLGAAARKRIIDYFSLASAVAQYEEAYESAMAQTSAGRGSELPLASALRSRIP